MNKDLGLKIKTLREEKKMTQCDLSKILGVSVGAVGMWESFKRAPSTELLVKISAYFNVSVDYLIGKDNCDFTYLNKNNERAKTEIQSLFDQLDIMRQRQVIGYVQAMLQTSQENINIKKGG